MPLQRQDSSRLADTALPGPGRPAGAGAAGTRRPLLSSPPTMALAGGIFLAAVLLSALVAPPGTALLLFLVAASPIVIVCRWDAVSVLTLAIVTLFGLSAKYSLGAGSPVALIGLFCFALWVAATLLARGRLLRERSPVRTATLVLLWFLLLGYAVAFTRVLSSAEASNGQRQFLTLFGAAGLTLLAADQIRDRRRLDVLLRRVVLMVAFMSVIAIVQYVFGRDLSEYLVPPGFSQLGADAAIAERSDLRRVAGTASHPIEFGVVLAMVLPLALHYAMTATTARNRQWAWTQAMIIGMALPLSISRSAVLSLAVALLTMVVVWDGRRQLNFLGGLFVFTAFFNVAVPGVLGTLRALFLWAGEDPSITGRTEDYALVWEMVAERPFLGRGLGTFVPTEYFFLDNQFLGTILEVGYVGLVVLLGWTVVGLSCARGVRRRATDLADRQLGQALVAGILAVLTSFATFDTLGFKQATFTLFLFVGCAGALWRTTVADRGVYAPAARPAGAAASAGDDFVAAAPDARS